MSSWVRSGALVGAPELITELGGDSADLAQAAGIDAAAFKDPDFPVPSGAVVKFLETAVTACQCESFGLQLAQRQDLSLLGPLWPLIQNATTVSEMLQDLARYFLLHTTGALISIESFKQGLMVNYSLATDTGKADRQTMELGIAILVGELKKSSPNWRPEQVFFRHSPPRNPNVHRKIFGANVAFNADRNALFVDAGMLAKPYGSGDVITHQTLATRFGAQRKQLPALLRVQTETVIRSLLPVSACDIAVAANVLKLSTRSLQRHLTDENTSFTSLLDAVRADLVLKYLRQSELAIADIADILGFSETSALTRAFRRWYGHSPRHERREASLAV